MKHFLSVLLLIISVLYAYSKDFEYHGIWYSVIDEEARTCETRAGTYEKAGAPSYNFSNQLIIPDTVFDGINKYAVVQIGDYSFLNCKFTNEELTNGEIPSSVKHIGKGAFCKTNIRKLILEENGVETMGENAFKCENLTFVYLPLSFQKFTCYDQSVTAGFYENILTQIVTRKDLKMDKKYESKKRYISETAKWDGDLLYSGPENKRTLEFIRWNKSGDLILSDDYVAFGGRFAGYQDLYTLLPKSFKNYDPTQHGYPGSKIAAPANNRYEAGYFESAAIGGFANYNLYFYSKDAVFDGYCLYDTVDVSNLYPYQNKPEFLNGELLTLIFNKFELPEEYTVMNGAEFIYTSFVNNANLKTINLPETLKYIVNSFYNLSNLSSVKFPQSLLHIYGCFINCALENIELPENLISVYAFESNNINLPSLKSIKFGKKIRSIMGFNNNEITELDIPNGVEIIRGFNNTKIEEVKFPESVSTIIGFSSCDFLQKVSLPKSLKELNNAFSNNPNLQYLEIPESVEIFIPEFNEEHGAITLRFHSIEPPLNTQYSGWWNNDKIRCIVPDGSLLRYSNYSTFKGYSMETESGLKSKVVDDGTFKYSAYDDTKEVILIYSPQTSTISIPNKIPVVLNDAPVFYNVSHIKDEVFANCRNLEKILLPTSLKSIGNLTFLNCTNLKTINLPETLELIGDGAFYGCTSLEEIIFPSSLRTIGQSVFQYCTNLKNVVFNEGIEYLNNGLFGYCQNLKDVSFSSTIKDISQAFAYSGIEEIDIPNSIENIPQSAFVFCTNLKRISLPNNLKYIEGSAFYSCRCLESIEIPKNTIEIAEHSFDQCSALKSVIFKGGPKKINSNAFRNCISLEKVEIPEGLLEIGYRAYENCSSLEEIILPSSLDNIYEEAFYECKNVKYIKLSDSSKPLIPLRYGSSHLDNPLFQGVFNKCYPKKLYLGRNTGFDYVSENSSSNYEDFDKNFVIKNICGIDSLEYVTIGNLIESIPSEMFRTAKLVDVKLGSNLKKIGSFAFAGNPLNQIIIPSKVTEICNYAFYGCDFKNITIGSGIKQIGEYAFHGFDNLEDVFITAINSPNANNNTFSWYGGSLHVPSGYIDSYANNPNCWYRFNNCELIKADKVIIDTESIYIEDNQSVQLSANVEPQNATLKTILWESSDPSICTVDNTGKVTFVGNSDINLNRIAVDSNESDWRTIEIRAYTLYDNTPIATCRVTCMSSGIDSIEADFDFDNSADYLNSTHIFSIDGKRISSNIDNLPKGVYIMSKNGKAKKILKK